MSKLRGKIEALLTCNAHFAVHGSLFSVRGPRGKDVNHATIGIVNDRDAFVQILKA